jgi:hypothetical protein
MICQFVLTAYANVVPAIGANDGVPSKTTSAAGTRLTRICGGLERTGTVRGSADCGTLESAIVSGKNGLFCTCRFASKYAVIALTSVPGGACHCDASSLGFTSATRELGTSAVASEVNESTP